MKGVILCARCRRKVDGACSCGSVKVLIRVNHNGRYYEYRRDKTGEILSSITASSLLLKINGEIKEKTFDPVAYTDKKVAERRFEHMIEKWLDEKIKAEKAGELSPGTIKNYSGYVSNYFTFLNDMDVREIGLEELTNFKDTLDGIGIKTRKNVINALKNFFNWLYERGTIARIPVFPKIKGNDSRQRQAIDIETQDAVLKNIPEIHQGIIEFLYETGLRPGEVCALLCGHIDLRTGTARIERTFSGNKLRATTKQHRVRTIPLSLRAFEIVEKYMQGKLPTQFLFINPTTGKNYLPDTLWRIWHYNAGLEGITLYEGTRHSFGSQLVQKNDITVIKELMGHSTIKTTEGYLHYRIKHLTSAVNTRRDNVIELDREQTKIEANQN